MSEKVCRWDFVSTFKPPDHLSVENGKISMLKEIYQGEIDYDFVSKAFLTTIKGAVGVNQPNLFGGANKLGNVEIVKIEKIYNCVIYERFIQEFKRMLRKYPDRPTK